MSDDKLIAFDYAIKYLLKDKGDYEIVEGFISALLGCQGYSPVKIKALLESESNKEDKDAKRSIADVVVEDQQGHKYIVEIDRAYTKFFLHKACFNTSRLIVDSISRSEDYSTIKKVFHISLIYFPFHQMEKPLYHAKTIMREADTEHPLDLHLLDVGGKAFDVHNVFPEYFVISVPLFNDVVRNEMDEWLYMMKHSDVKKDFKSAYMKKVAARLSILKMSPEERKVYNQYMNESLKERDRLISAEEKGEARGRAEGREEGIELGVQKTAINMLKQNLDITLIAEVTGLSLEQIQKLKQTL